MFQSWLAVCLFMGFLVSIPFAIKWLKIDRASNSGLLGQPTKLVSVSAIGPSQKIVTVEVGPSGSRTVLVLGVTSQHISLLHSSPTSNSSLDGEGGAVAFVARPMAGGAGE